MNSYSLETLEYAKLLELVSRNAQTPMGVECFALLRPLATRRELDEALAAITETIALNRGKTGHVVVQRPRRSVRRRRDPKDTKRLAGTKSDARDLTRLQSSSVCTIGDPTGKRVCADTLAYGREYSADAARGD